MLLINAVQYSDFDFGGTAQKNINRIKNSYRERSQMYRRSERSKRIDISSYGIPSRKQPLRFSVYERCPIKFISFF